MSERTQHETTEYMVFEEWPNDKWPSGHAAAGPFDSYSAALNYLVSYEKDLRTERKFNVVTGEDDLVWETTPIVNGWFEYKRRGSDHDPISVRIERT